MLWGRPVAAKVAVGSGKTVGPGGVDVYSAGVAVAVVLGMGSVEEATVGDSVTAMVGLTAGSGVAAGLPGPRGAASAAS